MQQLFIGEIPLSDGTVASVMLSESEARVEYRLWDGKRALFRFTGVAGTIDRNSAGQEIEALETSSIRSAGDPFVEGLLQERPQNRTAELQRFAFIGSWTMQPVLEIFAESVEAERAYGV
ncbi:hypothetical protein QWJ34_18120 [Saccharibacillus sp. CPCC 101409]|uniref:hypothetical protein n=1 Tax=Saccharibacillus sp. CPCC 101409 TaxID=3058041 RepID=UPI0026734CBA|nr:hypothetical protein [Saccharibacillus sp. CPCC 101409]MDO3411684.1 hypothetical protein [Saccharibacillus sp. CPCC 101409]